MRAMQHRLKRILKAGTWLYDGQAKGHIRIVVTNYFERDLPDDEIEPDYPPRDSNGDFYYIEYWVEGGGASVSNCFGSADEAARHAAAVLRSPITWER